MKWNEKKICNIRNSVFYVCLWCIAIWLFVFGKRVSVTAAETAADMSIFSGITVSPDKSAWTTDYLDTTNERNEKGYTIYTGVNSSLRSLQKGEHYYTVSTKGSLSIGKWVVAWPNAQCIHDIPYNATFCGFQIKNDSVCYSYYNNGWNAYCADCGELIDDTLFYGKSSTIGRITSMPANSMYLYICPYCEGLEQGRRYSHLCKAISNNFYEVVYEANSPIDDQGKRCMVDGYMPSTKHMYNNAVTYNGISAQELGYGDTVLRENAYICKGYEFVGWNTIADGSGAFYGDKSGIMNLTEEDGASVMLYAQWKKSQSSLVLDANGGTYEGQEIYKCIQDYQSTYYVNDNLIIPPAGYEVSFVTNGGSAVRNIITTKTFSDWEMQSGFQGSFENHIYTFSGTEGSNNVLKAQYMNDSFILPDSVKNGVSLEGWYTDSKLREEDFIGRPGEYVMVEKNTTLYAKWVTLTLWATEDYDAHNGKGAVDLRWEQKDGKSKFYKLFQSKDGLEWNEILNTETIEAENRVSEDYDAERVEKIFTVQKTGYYTLSAAGGSGADYSSKFKGGLGGTASAEYWLQKGDVVHVYVGTAGSRNNGGTNANGSHGGDSGSKGSGGGAATEIVLTRNGTNTPLLIAGGGGGANEKYSGGDGGIKLTSLGEKLGKKTEFGGGGGGAQGGNGGGTVQITTLDDTMDFAFKSKMIQNLEAGSVEVYGMREELETPFLKKVMGNGQDTWKWITELGTLHKTFQSGYTLWYNNENCLFFGNSTETAKVGAIPYIKAHVRNGISMYLAGTYETDGNTNLRIGGGLFRKDYGAAGHTRLRIIVENAETGEVIYNNFIYKGYSDNSTAGIAAVVDIDVSNARKVTIKLMSETEGTQEDSDGHESQVYFSDIIFYGKKIIVASETTGGSNYINTEFGCRNQKSTSGVNVGNGYAMIESRDIGYREETELSDVMAQDAISPDLVEEYSVKIVDTNKVKVVFEMPLDRGTTYYHLAKSYRLGNGVVSKLADSNITENTLTTGVDGYYYYVDLEEKGVVDDRNVWLTVSGRQEELVFTLTDSIMYLHIAAVDKAGNIGETQHIRLQVDPKLPTDPSYAEKRKLYTKALELINSEFVYKESEKTYYLKADGITEHVLLAEAYLDGAATQDYQINKILFGVGKNTQNYSEWLEILIPRVDIVENRVSFPNNSLHMEMSEGYHEYLQLEAVAAERKNHGETVILEKRFVIPSDGDKFMIYPQAHAELQEMWFHSDENMDKENGITIIPDGIAPTIKGLKDFLEFDVLDMTEQTIFFRLQAEDYESGLKEFVVSVKNRDNFLQHDFTCDNNGKIFLNIDKDDPLFIGDIAISALAVDHVGNVNLIGENGLTFTLETELYKERDPEQRIFKTGDGAILDIITTGYVEKLEVIFPEEFLVLCPDLALVYEYEYPCLRKMETIKFSIPLGIEEREYEITIKAYKNGEMLVSKQTLVIVEGNILDELRTRIRNNG